MRGKSQKLAQSARVKNVIGAGIAGSPRFSLDGMERAGAKVLPAICVR
jgi:hypothetical protein